MKTQQIEFAKKIIRIREKLIRDNKSMLDSKAKAIEITHKIKIHVDAYGKKWNDDNWRKFFHRHYNDFIYIIPSNNARDTYIKTLHSFL